MLEIVFLTQSDLLFLHTQEMSAAGTVATLRDNEMLNACLEAPKATYGGNYLMNVFEMAATYLVSICIRHPFTDGNKRVAFLSCVIFLELNGYEFEEKYEGEAADIIIDFLSNSKPKEFIVQYLTNRTLAIE